MSQPITLAPHERLDEVNDDLKLIQARDGLTFGTAAGLDQLEIVVDLVQPFMGGKGDRLTHKTSLK